MLKDTTLLLTRLPPTKICKLKISAIHRNPDPSTSFHFSLFFDLFLITLTAVTNKITQFFYMNGGNYQLDEHKTQRNSTEKWL